jgi:hypothetical protein
MIDSFLERQKRKIVIDRVLQSQGNQQILVTNPKEIKSLTALHELVVSILKKKSLINGKSNTLLLTIVMQTFCHS